MRFGRVGCVAVLKHFNEWIAQNCMDPEKSQFQIAYAKVAKDLWFSSPEHAVLQDLWNHRVKNKDPTRGCLRKVYFLLYYFFFAAKALFRKILATYFASLRESNSRFFQCV